MSNQGRLTTGQKWVVILIGLTSALAAGNLGRAAVALQYASRLPDLPTSVSLHYFAAIGGLWGAVFVLCTVGLSLFRPWGRSLTLAAVTLFQANVFVNRLLFDVSDYARLAIPRNAVLSAILLLVVWGLLSLPVVKSAFRPRDEDA